MTLDELGRQLDARAAGHWRVEGDHLALVEFWAADTLPEDVATGFAGVTRSVSLDRPELGIVGAVADRMPRISVARDLPPDVGSGLWLAKFGADRSIAVPSIRDGKVIAVGSVAVGPSIDDGLAIALMSQFLRGQQ